jgi:hypothetical protein
MCIGSREVFGSYIGLAKLNMELSRADNRCDINI